MTLEGFFESIKDYQAPDEVYINKQRRYGLISKQFKGYMIKCTWEGIDSNLEVMRDITSGYTRVLGQETKIPKYTPGKHIYWDDED